jgi:hypothetical protein
MLFLFFLFVFLVMAWIFVATFVGTAQVILPWTVTAAVLGIVGALAIARSGAGQPQLAKKLAPVSRLGAFALTFLFGYLGCLMFPPSVAVIPQRDPQREMMEALVMPRIRPTQEDLWQMLPIHLGVAGACALTATMILAPLVEGNTKQKPAVADAGAGI